MKKWMIIAWATCLLAGCTGEKKPAEPERYPKQESDSKGVRQLEKELAGKTTVHVKEVDLTGDARKEVVAVYHDKSTAYFKVYQQKDGKWREIYADAIPSEDPYSIGLTYSPYENGGNAHVLFYKTEFPGGLLSYFVIGEGLGEMEKLLDNDTTEDAMPVYQGSFSVVDGGLVIESDSQPMDRFTWLPGTKEYRYEELE